MSHDYDFRLIILGESGVGKTSLVDRFCFNNYKDHYDVTVGVEYASKIVEIQHNNKKVRVRAHFWDTAGQEIFRSITVSYLKDTAGVVLCYDITNNHSFNRINYWIENIRNESPDAKIILVGTKIDLDYMKAIPIRRANFLAKKEQVSFMEVSAKENINVNELFVKLIKEIYVDYCNGSIKSGIKSPKNSLKLRASVDKNHCCIIM